MMWANQNKRKQKKCEKKDNACGRLIQHDGFFRAINKVLKILIEIIRFFSEYRSGFVEMG